MSVQVCMALENKHSYQGYMRRALIADVGGQLLYGGLSGRHLSSMIGLHARLVRCKKVYRASQLFLLSPKQIAVNA